MTGLPLSWSVQGVHQVYTPQSVVCTCRIFQVITSLTFEHSTEGVNLSKRGGMDRVFQGLVVLGMLQGIFHGQRPREILRSGSASPRKTPSIQTLLIIFTFYMKQTVTELSPRPIKSISCYISASGCLDSCLPPALLSFGNLSPILP